MGGEGIGSPAADTTNTPTSVDAAPPSLCVDTPASPFQESFSPSPIDQTVGSQENCIDHNGTPVSHNFVIGFGAGGDGSGESGAKDGHGSSHNQTGHSSENIGKSEQVSKVSDTGSQHHGDAGRTQNQEYNDPELDELMQDTNDPISGLEDAGFNGHGDTPQSPSGSGQSGSPGQSGDQHGQPSNHTATIPADHISRDDMREEAGTGGTGGNSGSHHSSSDSQSGTGGAGGQSIGSDGLSSVQPQFTNEGSGGNGSSLQGGLGQGAADSFGQSGPGGSPHGGLHGSGHADGLSGIPGGMPGQGTIDGFGHAGLGGSPHGGLNGFGHGDGLSGIPGGIPGQGAAEGFGNSGLSGSPHGGLNGFGHGLGDGTAQGGLHGSGHADGLGSIPGGMPGQGTTGGFGQGGTGHGFGAGGHGLGHGGPGDGLGGHGLGNDFGPGGPGDGLGGGFGHSGLGGHGFGQGDGLGGHGLGKDFGPGGPGEGLGGSPGTGHGFGQGAAGGHGFGLGDGLGGNGMGGGFGSTGVPFAGDGTGPGGPGGSGMDHGFGNGNGLDPDGRRHDGLTEQWHFELLGWDGKPISLDNKPLILDKGIQPNPLDRHSSGTDFGSKWNNERPPGLPEDVRRASPPGAALPHIQRIAQQQGLGSGFTQTITEIAKREGGGRFGLPSRGFDARPPSERPVGKGLNTAWGAFQFNQAAWHKLPGMQNTAPWQATPQQELELPIQKYAEVFQSIQKIGGNDLDAGRGVFMWQKGPGFFNHYYSEAAKHGFDHAWQEAVQNWADHSKNKDKWKNGPPIPDFLR